MKKKIISIIHHPPPYELYANIPRPNVNWETHDGQWVGIRGYEWADLLGNEILKLADEFEYEVWQPDLRADKIYSHTFGNGLIHKLFPAMNRKKLYGAKLINEISLDAMTTKLEEQRKGVKLILLHLHGNPLLFKKFLLFFENLPIFLSYHGIIHLPSKNLFSPTYNILSKLNHIIDYFWLKKNINKIDYITYQNNKYVEHLKRIYKGGLIKITMGCDFSFWRPGDKENAKNQLDIPLKEKIFFTASALRDIKQIDRLISTFSELSDKYNFILIIAGDWSKGYIDYLHNLASELLKKNKIRFMGYIRGEQLRQFYWASDFFLSLSKGEGGPVSVIQAFACEVPVISTKTGNTAELMEQYKCGCLLDIFDYKMWKNELEEILEDKKEVKLMSREIAKQHYEWSSISQKFIDIYREITKKYYSGSVKLSVSEMAPN